MKKISFLLLALLPVVASAQNDNMRVSITPHAGMTIDIGDGMSSIFLWENYQTKESEDVSGQFRRIIYDIPVGLSYEWQNIVLNATYRFEVRKAIHHYAYDTSWVPMQDALTARNHAILITLGYRFKL